jgi:UDP-glucuronate 4-epimerase
VALLERELGRKAETELHPMQPGDVPETFAATDDLAEAIGFRPSTNLEEGIKRFAAWYLEHRHLTSA